MPGRDTIVLPTLRRWFAPDLALVAFTVTLLYCLVLADAPRSLFRDSDSGWHIRNGESILSSGRLPAEDPFSFSRPEARWFAWEWGADVLMGAAHRKAGLGGVVFLYLLAIAATSYVWVCLHWASGGDFLLACAMASPFLSTVNIHWLARPHVLGWILLLIWLWRLETAPRAFRWRDGLLAAGLAIVWCNLHASFFLQPLVAVFYAAGRARRGWCLAAAAVSLAASLCNPYGPRLHHHVWVYLTDRELLSRVGEFQSFNFHSEGAFQIVATVGLSAVGAVLAAQQGRIDRALVIVFFATVALRSARGLPVVALTLPLANGAITTALRRSSSPVIGASVRYSANLRRIDQGLRGWLVIPVLILASALTLGLPAVRTKTGFPPDQFPVGASAAIEKLPSSARIFAPDKFGGYLIYRFSGSRKVFFDGRSDFYGVEFMKDFIRMVQVRPGWEGHFERWRFTHALLPVDYSLAAVLPLKGWRETYRDETAVLLEAPLGQSP
jgi:hypothetical protein